MTRYSYRFTFGGITAALLMFINHLFAQGYPPAEAVKKMKVADGFEVKLVASEPMVAQPVCIEFDDRGRLWVIQYLQYPNPAGLKRVKVDRFSRTVYDRVPEPPPRGPKGADRITILERVPTAADQELLDRSAQFPFFPSNGSTPKYKAKDFVNGLNLASGMAFGHGGVFILQVPYLLFYPDRNRDDVPDSDPEVLLTGFGMEDAHSVANSLTWGPDGWLYGCQGSTVTANIRGIEFQQGVWRYHPITKRFELFCEGGGNSWGIDFDEDGNIIYSTNFGGYRALHAAQGGYFWKQFGKHGALHNPYAYGYIDHMPHENFFGGHVTVSGMIYRGDSFPEKFRNQYIHVDTLGHGILWSKIHRNGSSFKTSHGGELLAGNDTWFAPCDGTIGPDSALYFTDWHDKRTAHPDPDADWDLSNGRIYRLQATNAINEFPTGFDFRKVSADHLVDTILKNSNEWWVRKARRALADRRDVIVYPKLRAEVFGNKDNHRSLEALWALHVSGGADEAFLNDCLDHSFGPIRKWAVRLLGDENKVSLATAEHLIKLAETEADLMVRNQLICTAKRLPAKDGLPIAHKIAMRNLDSQDAQIPLLLWWSVEKHSVAAVDEVLNLFASPAAWQTSLIRETVLPRLIRRYAAEGSDKTLTACGQLLENSPTPQRSQMLASLEQGLREQPATNRISKLEKLPSNLRDQLTSLWKDDTTDETVLRLLSRLDHAPARQRTLALMNNSKSSPALRTKMVQLFAESTPGNDISAFSKLISSSEPEELKLAAIEALHRFDSPEILSFLQTEYPKMSDRLRSKTRDVLLARKTWALALLQQVDAGKIPAKEIPLEQIRQVSLHQDKQLDDIVRKHWGNVSGGSTEEKLADIRRFNNDLRAEAGNAKNGHAVFLKTCAACHELFGEGEKVGPELTHANRQDKDFLLSSIVDPSAVIRKEYLNYNLELSDGRVLTGLIAEQSANSVTLVVAKNEKSTVDRDKITAMQESTISLMPEGLMHGLTPQERRDLFAYLQSTKPVEKANREKREKRLSNWIKISADKNGFQLVPSGQKFTPFGFNYDRDYKMRLIEDYWDSEWQTIVSDFEEMKKLGANVVRVHLQFARFMNSPAQPNQQSLQQLTKLLSLAEETGLYLDLTGLACYRKQDVPKWFDALSENDRWAAQARFWEAIAETCRNSPAVFCYDLLNEPVVPGKQAKEWYLGPLAGFYYLQAITLDSSGRNRTEIARQWIQQMTAAIRKHDQKHLITVGLLPNSATEPISGSGFPPREIASDLDFISVHFYPESGKVKETLDSLKKFKVGKPVVIEETMIMKCSGEELREFILNSRETASGWIGFYWGQTPAELTASGKIEGVLMIAWLKLFQELQPSIL